MTRNYKALLTAAISAAAIAVSGVSAASAASPGAAKPSIAGIEHFQSMTTSATSPKARIIATGVFTAGGVDASGKTADTVTFPGGTFKINHGAAHGTQTLNPKTCLFTVRETASYTLGGGTGSYTGISGHGTAAITILAVTARNAKGKCSLSLPPDAWEQVIKASGPVHL